jgi:hypothetical protein
VLSLSWRLEAGRVERRPALARGDAAQRARFAQLGERLAQVEVLAQRRALDERVELGVAELAPPLRELGLAVGAARRPRRNAQRSGVRELGRL